MLRIVEWRGVFRILDDADIIVAVCESRDEAEAYVTGDRYEPSRDVHHANG